MDRIPSKKTEDQNISEFKKYRIAYNNVRARGLSNPDGTLFVDFRFRILSEFECGLALVGLVVGDHAKYGYLNKEGSIFWLTKEYSMVSSFSEELAIVHRFYGYDRQMYGYINLNFDEVIPLIYHGAKEFKFGRAAVCNEKQDWGFIDNKGVQVVPFTYYIVESFADGLAKASIQIGENKYMNPILKYGFIDITGKTVIPFIYEEAQSFNEGLAVVGTKNSIGEVIFGFINTKGNIIIRSQYLEAKPFSENLAAVSLEYNKFFFINKNGEKVTDEIECNWIGSIENGFANFGVGYGDYMKYGIVDKKGKIIIQPIFKSYINCDDDFFKAGFINEKTYTTGWDLYDKQGHKLTSRSYFEIFTFIEGFAIVQTYHETKKDFDSGYKLALYGFINKKGQEIVPCIYEDILEFRGGIAAVKQDGKWGFVNAYGDVSKIEFDDICLYNDTGYIYSISQYRTILEVSQNLPSNFKFFIGHIGFVIKNKMYGIVDPSGREIAPCIYEAFRPSKNQKFNDLLVYKKQGKYGFINRNGMEICSPIYWTVFDFSDGLAACNKDGKWGFINSDGDVVIPYKYFSVGSFNFGLASVKINNLWGYINKSDVLVIKPMFQVAQDFILDNSGDTLAYVEKWDGKSPQNDRYIIDKKGEIIEKII